MYDAIVVGGGIVGASLAYHLVKGGANTLLIDRHHEGRATDAGAGILSAESSALSSDSWYRFSTQAFHYYTPMIAALNAGQDQDTGFAVCGLLRVAVDDDELDAFNQAHEVIFGRQASLGLSNSAEVAEITPQEAKQHFPALSPVQRAIYHRDAARVDGRKLCTALTNAAVNHGLQVKNALVDRLILDDGRVTGVVVDGEEIKAGKVAIAGGAWSTHFGDQLGVHIPVEPQRGQIIHLQLDRVDTAQWSVVHAFHGHYMVAWEGGRVAVGATRETGSGFKPNTSAQGIHEVLGEAMRVAEGLRTARLIEIRVGLRPYVADGHPVLGNVPNVENIYVATGHGASGLQLGPYSGKVIADMMLGHPVADDLQPFHISRFT